MLPRTGSKAECVPRTGVAILAHSCIAHGYGRVGLKSHLSGVVDKFVASSGSFPGGKTNNIHDTLEAKSEAKACNGKSQIRARAPEKLQFFQVKLQLFRREAGVGRGFAPSGFCQHQVERYPLLILQVKQNRGAAIMQPAPSPTTRAPRQEHDQRPRGRKSPRTPSPC